MVNSPERKESLSEKEDSDAPYYMHGFLIGDEQFLLKSRDVSRRVQSKKRFFLRPSRRQGGKDREGRVNTPARRLQKEKKKPEHQEGEDR